jgi:hypothetical protein
MNRHTALLGSKLSKNQQSAINKPEDNLNESYGSLDCSSSELADDLKDEMPKMQVTKHASAEPSNDLIFSTEVDTGDKFNSRNQTNPIKDVRNTDLTED